FEISTPDHVVALSFYGTGSENYFKVVNDIDMSSAKWTSYIDNFKANLDGNGKVLSNVTIGAEGNDSLFGKIDGGKIDGLGIAGIDVTVTGSNGGMLASSATNGAAITNSYVVGTLSTSASDDQSNIGGLVGETDNATIDGCIVSGKIVSDSSRTGGVIGSALDGSVIRNVLSTAYVDGGAGVTGGIVGTAEDSAEITSCIFASDIKSTNAQTEGNIIGDGSAGDENCYYDKQMSSVIDSANGVSTHYLTGGATMEQLGFGESMVRIEGFAGYPVPAAFVNEEVSDQFLAGVKLASAKINLASGAGAGTVNSFTNITAPSDLGTYSAQLEFGGGTPAYLVSVADTQIDTDTSTLALGDVVNRYVTYTLVDGSFDGGKMLRYLDLYVGKTMKVTYKFVDLESDANAVLTVFSGMSNVSSVTAFAVAGKHSGELCSSMVIPYDSDEGAYILRVGSELPSGKAIKAVSADVLESGSSVLDSKLSGEELDNGSWKIKLETNGSIDCDEIEITVTVDDDSAWGIHKYFNLF
ncbi:MAG: hypothetical protein IJ261_05785, partial [Clostridia bacterium]|nr:hypothetical protein [Clostridia bacterium]